VPWAAIAVAVLVQLAWAPRWGLAEGKPDVVTLVAICLAFLGGPQTGAVAGFAGGLALDALGMGPLGVGALARAVAGFLAGLVEQNVFGKSVLMPRVAVAVATFAAQMVELLLLLLLGRDLPFFLSLGRIVLPTAVYNGVLAGAIYPFLAWAGQRERGRPPIGQLG
jgi:rod shape-determining protein MreD